MWNKEIAWASYGFVSFTLTLQPNYFIFCVKKRVLFRFPQHHHHHGRLVVVEFAIISRAKERESERARDQEKEREKDSERVNFCGSHWILFDDEKHVQWTEATNKSALLQLCVGSRNRHNSNKLLTNEITLQKCNQQKWRGDEPSIHKIWT